jgi:hypothetical protein
VCGSAASEAGELIADHVRYWKVKNALILRDRYDRFAAKRRSSGKSVPAPPALALSILENASMEDDDSLQDMWAHLLVSATDEGMQPYLKRSFPEMLRTLDPIDAHLLTLLHQRYVALFAPGATYIYRNRHCENGRRLAETAKLSIEDAEVALLHLMGAMLIETVTSTQPRRLGLKTHRRDGKLTNIGDLSVVEENERPKDLVDREVALSALGVRFMQACTGLPDPTIISGIRIFAR